MKIHNGKAELATKPDIRRKWQLLVALALVFTVMAVSVTSCPGDIRGRSTTAIVASL